MEQQEFLQELFYPLLYLSWCFKINEEIEGYQRTLQEEFLELNSDLIYHSEQVTKHLRLLGKNFLWFYERKSRYPDQASLSFL